MARPSVLERKQYRSLAQVAAELGMSPNTLTRYMREGLLPLAQSNANGVWLFTPAWFEKARAKLAPKAG